MEKSTQSKSKYSIILGVAFVWFTTHLAAASHQAPRYTATMYAMESGVSSRQPSP